MYEYIKVRRQVAGEKKSFPRSLPPFGPLRRQTPYLDRCTRVSPTEMLKGNREAFPRRVQVVLDYLKVEGKVSSEFWAGVWGAAILSLPKYSVFLCIPNLGSHEPRRFPPTPPIQTQGVSHLRSVCQVPFPITLAEELQEWIRFPQEVLSMPQRPVIKLREKPLCQTSVPTPALNTPFQSL